MKESMRRLMAFVQLTKDASEEDPTESLPELVKKGASSFLRNSASNSS